MSKKKNWEEYSAFIATVAIFVAIFLFTWSAAEKHDWAGILGIEILFLFLVYMGKTWPWSKKNKK
jgi:hypothetical protein